LFKQAGRLAGRSWHSPTLTTSGSIAVRLLGLAVLLPLALNRLPVEEANLWFLFSSVLAIQGLIDFGFSATFIRFVAYSRSENPTTLDRPALVPDFGSESSASRAVISTMRTVYNRLGILAFVALAAAGSFAVAGPIGHIDVPKVGWTAWSVIVVAGTIGLRGGMYSAYLQGSENIALFRRWEIVVGLTSTIAACLALFAGAGLLGLVISIQAGIIVNTWINRALAIRVSSRDQWSHRTVKDKLVMDAVWPAAWRSGIGVLISAGVIQATGVLYAQLAAPAESAPYLLALRLINAIRLFSNVPFYTKLPAMAKAYAGGQSKRLIEITRIGMIRSNWLLTAGVLAISFIGARLLYLVGSKTPFVAAEVWGLLGLAILSERIGAMHLQLYSTTNHVVWHIANGVSGFIMLIAMPIMYKWFNILGFPLSILIGYVMFYIPYSMRLSYRAFDLKIGDIDLMASVFPVSILITLELVLLS
jgi:hypothetical protein